jgi:DNA-binding SARP family transcriptional activator
VKPLVESTRELTRSRRYELAERQLGDHLASGLAPPKAAPTVRSLRQLCAVAGEHRRLADELEISVREHRVAEHELAPAIDGLLAAWTLAVEAPQDDAGSRARTSRPDPATELDRRARAPGVVPEPSADASSWDAAPPARPPPPTAPDSAAPSATDESVATGSGAHVDVRVLGPLEIAIDGCRIARWGSLKARALFQYLVYHGDRPIRRDLLMDAFWPGYNHQSARNNLNVSLHNLRRTLELEQAGEYVLYADGCYLLNRDLIWSIDRDAFLARLRSARDHLQANQPSQAIDTYQRAVELYRGPLFEDDTTSEWHLPEQRRLEDLCLRALEHLADLYLERNTQALAEQAVLRALSVDPCRESSHRLLMRCYAQQQQHHLVTRQFQLCAETLRGKLGITPAPETIQLCQALTTRSSLR